MFNVLFEQVYRVYRYWYVIKFGDICHTDEKKLEPKRVIQISHKIWNHIITSDMILGVIISPKLPTLW